MSEGNITMLAEQDERAHRVLDRGQELVELHGERDELSHEDWCQLIDAMSEADLVAFIAWNNLLKKNRLETAQWKASLKALPSEGAGQKLASVIDDFGVVDEIHARTSIPKASSSAAAVEKGMNPKEKLTALKLILGMAVAYHGYDPTKSRSPIPREIAEELHRVGLTITDDTVRKWLQEAGDEFGGDLLPFKADT